MVTVGNKTVTNTKKKKCLKEAMVYCDEVAEKSSKERRKKYNEFGRMKVMENPEGMFS